MFPSGPVVSGLLHGFNLASQMKQQALQQQALERSIARDAEDKQVRDLQTQMSLSDRGYKPSTPDQDAEIATGRTKATQMATPGLGGMMQGAAQPAGADGTPGGNAPVMPSPSVGNLQSSGPSDIKERVAKFNGQTYVRDSDAEIRSKQKKAAAADLEDKVAQAQALGDVSAQSAGKAAKAKLDATGITVDDETAAKYGIPKGTKFEQGPGFAAMLNRIGQGTTPKPVGAGQNLTDDNGNVTRVTTMTDGTVKKESLGALGKKTKPTGALTAYQTNQIARQKQADADKATMRNAQHTADQTAFDQHHAEIGKLNTEEQGVWSDSAAIVKSLRSGVDPNGKKVLPATAKQLHQQLNDNAKQIKALQAQQQAHMKAKTDILTRFAGRDALGGYGAAAPAANANDPAGILGAQ